MQVARRNGGRGRGRGNRSCGITMSRSRSPRYPVEVTRELCGWDNFVFPFIFLLRGIRNEHVLVIGHARYALSLSYIRPSQSVGRRDSFPKCELGAPPPCGRNRSAGARSSDETVFFFFFRPNRTLCVISLATSHSRFLR